MVLDEMLTIAEKQYVSAFDLVFAWLGAADVERALDSLERAVEERSIRVTELLIDPRLGRLASDHRFQPAARRIGLTAGLLDSNVVLDAGSENRAVGRCTLDLGTGIGLCTFSDGTGRFSGFQARLDGHRKGNDNEN